MAKKNTDTVPAMLTPGEVVLNAKQQKRLGELVGMPVAEVFKKIGVPGFAKGGKVLKNPKKYINRNNSPDQLTKLFHALFDTTNEIWKKRIAKLLNFGKRQRLTSEKISMKLEKIKELSDGKSWNIKEFFKSDYITTKDVEAWLCLAEIIK